MKRDTFSKFIEHHSLSFLTGFGVVCIHILLTSVVVDAGDFLWLILVAPGYIPVFIFDSSSTVFQFIATSFSETFLIKIVPAVLYGMVAGLLVSREKLLRVVAVILIIVFLVSVCLLFLLAVQTSA